MAAERTKVRRDQREEVRRLLFPTEKEFYEWIRRSKWQTRRMPKLDDIDEIGEVSDYRVHAKTPEVF